MKEVVTPISIFRHAFLVKCKVLTLSVLQLVDCQDAGGGTVGVLSIFRQDCDTKFINSSPNA